eukprot:comp22265_c0_seq1/m.32924 comp22265_c0_seq1/g.32924  ORF comp22265_c0_seq1/g.32924 comp22265_c0_seq1/m.32924 type:complete len:573 (-) comp22265_c0_seq1:391-2109(-)
MATMTPPTLRDNAVDTNNATEAKILQHKTSIHLTTESQDDFTVLHCPETCAVAQERVSSSAPLPLASTSSGNAQEMAGSKGGELRKTESEGITKTENEGGIPPRPVEQHSASPPRERVNGANKLLETKSEGSVVRRLSQTLLSMPESVKSLVSPRQRRNSSSGENEASFTYSDIASDVEDGDSDTADPARDKTVADTSRFCPRIQVGRLMGAIRRRTSKKEAQKEEEETPTQKQWNDLSKYLQTLNLRNIKLLPHVIEPPSGTFCPALGEGKEADVVRIDVLKRFNSRKLPHLLVFTNIDGKEAKFIYKQDDDISMDVAVVRLFEYSNEAWRQEGLNTRIRTYNVVACPDNTGFVEVVPGKTMLSYHAKEVDELLGCDCRKWAAFYYSMLAVMVVTCAFDITDRHHNNVMLAPEGDIVLIDLSASLGKKAPLDKGLMINPIYFPDRFKKVGDMLRTKRSEAGVCAQSEDFVECGCSKAEKLMDLMPGSRWSDLEAAAMKSYYALYNNRDLGALLKEAGYKMPKAMRFLTLLNERKHRPQIKEGLRNDIVGTMDRNETVNKMVASLSSALSLN